MSSKVVIVDDDRLIRERCAEVLAGRGFHVLMAERGAELLEKIRQERVDVVLLDLVLPDGAGTDLLPFIREIDPDLPVVIITGYAALENAVEAMKRGAYDFIEKPVQPDVLLNAVHRALEKRLLDVRNRRLMLELSQKVNEFLMLHQVGEAINSTLDLNEILRALVGLARNALSAEACSLFLLDRAEEALSLEVAVTEAGLEGGGQRIPRGQGIVGGVAESGQPALAPAAPAHPRFVRAADEALGRPVRSLLAVPLRSKGRVIGVLATQNKRGRDTFDEDDLRLLGLIGTQASVAIENGRLYRQVRQQLDDLQRLEEMKEHLMQLLVHDLQNPLTSITLYLEMAAPAREDDLTFLNDARRSCKQLTTMVDDLLDIGRMEEGRLKLDVGPLDLAALIREGVATVRPVAAEDGKEIALEIAPDLPTVLGDRDIVGRVLGNLLSNAIKHSFPQGRIAVRAAPHAAPEFVRVDVMDNGEGIPKEYHQRIFEKFGQVESRLAGRRTGRGLGLTFCKMAVEAHGGRIWLQSEPNQGSTFSLTLPAQLPTSSAGSQGRKERSR